MLIHFIKIRLLKDKIASTYIFPGKKSQANQRFMKNL